MAELQMKAGNGPWLAYSRYIFEIRLSIWVTRGLHWDSKYDKETKESSNPATISRNPLFSVQLSLNACLVPVRNRGKLMRFKYWVWFFVRRRNEIWESKEPDLFSLKSRWVLLYRPRQPLTYSRKGKYMLKRTVTVSYSLSLEKHFSQRSVQKRRQ